MPSTKVAFRGLLSDGISFQSLRPIYNRKKLVPRRSELSANRNNPKAGVATPMRLRPFSSVRHPADRSNDVPAYLFISRLSPHEYWG